MCDIVFSSENVHFDTSSARYDPGVFFSVGLNRKCQVLRITLLHQPADHCNCW